MNIVQNHIKGGFTMIPNTLIEDKSISDRARFLYISLVSKPTNWTFYTQQLSKSLGMHKDTFRKYRDELCSKGWIWVEEQKISNGTFTSRTYHLFESPILNNENSDQSSKQEKRRNLPSRKKTVTENFRHGKNPPLNNTDYRTINTEIKKNKKDLIKGKNSISQNPNPRS